MQGFGQEQQQNAGSDLIYWIWLSTIPGIGIKSRRLLLENIGDPRKIYESDEEIYRGVPQIGNSNRIKNIDKNKSLEKAKRILDDCDRNNISIMTMRDMSYPEYAKSIPDMPTHLYYKGTPQDKPAGVAIVGARRCTQEGKMKAAELAKETVKADVPVISGMAKGIDSYAHTACILNHGYTIAVLGNGLDICYPREHNLLKQRIEENGLLLSEFSPGVQPIRGNFPRRNRIIAAWSEKIYVIEAGKNSGALITGNYGRKFGRKVVNL